MADYEFKYAPLTGRLTGKQMIEQTEQAINGLAGLVDEAAGQVEIISTLANEANENAATALEVANEALATTGRTYITVSIPADANDYYDSQLIYIADSTSTNIPVADTGMLEVKTNDNKTACEQVFVADSSGEAYYRHGDITAETVGDVTTYTVTWGGWSSEPASQAYVQGELANYAPLSALDNYAPLTDLANYLPLAGGTMTGKITRSSGTGLASRDVDTSFLYIGGGTTDSNGAYLSLYGKDHSNAGRFILAAKDGTNSTYLNGLASGSLNWDGKEVERVNASGSDYIRFQSGLQICWGYAQTTTSGHTYTFPVSFDTNPKVAFSVGNTTESNTSYSTKITGLSKTSFKGICSSTSNTGQNITCTYIAVGFWK